MAIFQKSSANTASAAPPGARAEAPGGDGARLHVGRDLRLQGSVENCDTLVVEGYMKATSVHSKQVIIAATGVLEGEVGADGIEVHGRFTGTLLARVFLDVRATGTVDGDISYGELAVARGGRLCGRIRRAEGKAEAGAAPAEAPAAGVFVPRAS